MKSLMRSTIFIFLLPCILCSFINASKDGTEIQMRRKKVKRCNLIDFVGFNNPGRCCLEKPGSPFQLTQLMANICNNGTLFDDAYLYEYKFNRLLTPSNHFTVKFNKKKQISKMFAEVACIMECMSILGGLMDSNQLIVREGVDLLLLTFSSPAWKPIINAGIDACLLYTTTLRDVTVTHYNKYKQPQQCLVGPLLLVQCVQTYLIGRCPPSLQVANPSVRCMDEIAAMDQCSAMFNLPPLFPTSESNSEEH